ncbi:MAG: tetratricopeptide repeat protein [Acidobacteria bacterium]|nr:tetratricopeptide repeat protein [Acidobacteriota bacterium]
MKNIVFLLAVMILAGPALPADTGARDGDIRQQKIFEQIFLHHEYVWERKFQAAQACLEEALRIQPDNPVTLFTISQLLREERGREDAAKLYFKKALDNLNVATPGERLYLDMTLLRKHNNLSRTELKEKIDAFLDTYPENGLVFYSAGAFFQKELGEFEKAIRFYKKSLDILPWLTQAHNLLGYAYSYLGDQTNAIRHLESYAAAFPARANPHDSLGEIYHMTGQYQLAIEQYDTALAIAPDFTIVHQHLIRSCTAVGQYARAKEHALLLLEKSESDHYKGLALFEYARICMFSGDYEKAEHKIRLAMEMNPDYFGYHDLLGQIQLQSGQMEQVQQTLHSMKRLIEEQAQKYPNKFPSEYFYQAYELLQAKINVALGNFDTALFTLQQINDRNTNPLEGLSERADLARVYFAIGEFSRALAVTRSILKYNPNHVETLVLQAKIYTTLSRQKEAEAALDRCAALLQDADPGIPISKEIDRLRQITVALK